MFQGFMLGFLLFEMSTGDGDEQVAPIKSMVAMQCRVGSKVWMNKVNMTKDQKIHQVSVEDAEELKPCPFYVRY